MSSQPAFDTARVQMVLHDLLQSTRGEMPLLELTLAGEATPAVRGVANRAGLLRFGLRLALAAIEADPAVTIHTDGSVTGPEKPGVLELVLTEEAKQPSPPERWVTVLLAALTSVFYLATLVLAMIGIASLWRDRGP
jgi:hypothetical protein